MGDLREAAEFAVGPSGDKLKVNHMISLRIQSEI